MICAYDDASKVGKFFWGGRVLNRFAFFWCYPENMEGLVKIVSENQIIVTKAVNKSKVNQIFLVGITFFVIFKSLLHLEVDDTESCFLATTFFYNPFEFFRILSAVPNCQYFN